MENNYITIVSREFNQSIKNQLFIDNNNLLSYLDDDSRKHIILNSKNINRPLYISEVIDKLNSRYWNLGIRKCIVQDNLKLLKLDNSEGSMNFSNKVYKKTTEVYNSTNLITDKDKEYIMEKYNNIINEEHVLYNSSKLLVDILNGSVTFNLIDSDNYTNTIDLLGLETKLVKENISSKVDLSIRYSIDNLIYDEDFTFTAFSFRKDKDNIVQIVHNNLVTSLDNISIEYLNGTIKVFPTSDKVNECIISNCMVTYGNI